MTAYLDKEVNPSVFPWVRKVNGGSVSLSVGIVYDVAFVVAMPRWPPARGSSCACLDWSM